MPRKKIIAGNWKMNCNRTEAGLLATEINSIIEDEVRNNAYIILSPSFVYLSYVAQLCETNKRISVAAQNCSYENSGAFTGEVSAGMIKSAGAQYVIIGHSERRSFFNETDAMLAQKVKRALENNLQVIFCIGEKKEERESNTHFNVVKEQLEKGIFDLTTDEFKNIIIAYEPVWAIGTGLTASPEQAQEIHAYIRKLVKEKYSNDVAQSTSILYGGSCNEGNAARLFALADVDGGLIGGASLKSRSFVSIIKAMQ
jgi:triosephosphate isomerase